MKVVAFLVILDQLTKILAARFLSAEINSGSIFGLYIGKFPLFSLIIAALALVILSADVIGHKKFGIGEILILSGGISNLLDRILGPGVVDWIAVLGMRFNLADTYITLGVIYLISSKLNESIH